MCLRDPAMNRWAILNCPCGARMGSTIRGDSIQKFARTCCRTRRAAEPAQKKRYSRRNITKGTLPKSMRFTPDVSQLVPSKEKRLKL